MRASRRPLAGIARQEMGQAMLIVGVALVILTLIPVAIVTTTLHQLPLTTHDTDYNAAFEAAQAGLSDYEEHLSQDSDYAQYNATTLPPPAYGIEAFNTWVPVPGPTTNPPEWFMYAPNLTEAASSGVVLITVSGKAGASDPVIRTIQVGLRQTGFLDFVYFTNYETTDPASYTDSGDAQTHCQYHQYEFNPNTKDPNQKNDYGPDPNPWTDAAGHSYSCSNINFATADNINGPVHSNDGFYMCGDPTFEAAVTDSDPTSAWVNGSGCTGSVPDFSDGAPTYEADLALPPSDTSLETDATQTTPTYGCLYTGPTTITFNGSGTYQGTMNVTSPGTLSASNTTKTSPAKCLGNDVALPTDGVIYVQNVPTSGPNHPATPCSSLKQSPEPETGAPYVCTNGDVFVGNATSNGGLAGQLTVVSEDDVVIQNSITYAGGLNGTDVLGLIADNFVQINHPVAGTSPNQTDDPICGSSGASAIPNCDLSSPTVDAAILSLAHSFEVNNYAVGASLGTLAVNGSIAQNFRGPVATVNTQTGKLASGYGKSYTYDPRLVYLSPPSFLDPVASSWYPVSYAEITSTGTVA